MCFFEFEATALSHKDQHTNQYNVEYVFILHVTSLWLSYWKVMQYNTHITFSDHMNVTFNGSTSNH